MSLPAFKFDQHAAELSTFRFNKSETMTQFGLKLVNDVSTRGYQVMSGDIVWFDTNCNTYPSAIKETVRELQLRCYLPVSAQDIVANTQISQNTNFQLQQHIGRFGDRAATQIKCVVDLLEQLAFVLNRPAKNPTQMAFNPFLKTYLMTWQIDKKTKFSVRVHGNLTVDLECDKETVTLRYAVDHVFDEYKLTPLVQLLQGNNRVSLHQPSISTTASPVKTYEQRKQDAINVLNAELYGF